MSTRDSLIVSEAITIPQAELDFRASRSGGPGGQHVNTSSTRVELLWNLAASRAIDDATRARLAERLASRIDAQGNVRVVASEFRSQAQNRERAEARLVELVRRALVVPRKRKATKPTRAAKEARLAAKRRRSSIKRDRRRGSED
jgi:ribosome-associated protein